MTHRPIRRFVVACLITSLDHLLQLFRWYPFACISAVGRQGAERKLDLQISAQRLEFTSLLGILRARCY